MMTNSKIKIYLDLDSVLINCNKGFAAKFNLEIPAKTSLKNGFFEKFWTKDNRDLLGYDFWFNLELYPWSMDIINMVEKYDQNFFFITSCISNSGCASGKFDFIKYKIGEKYLEKLILCVKNNKHPCAGPNKLLIDDKESNCKKWSDYGGSAIEWIDYTEDMIDEANKQIKSTEQFILSLNGKK